MFTAPNAHTWRQIALGWVLYRKPAVVTDIIRILGDLANRTWTICHKFFYRAAWQLDMLCKQLLIHAVEPMIRDAGQVDSRTDRLVADLNIDDTTAVRYGNHVAHAHWLEDASANGPAQNGTVIHWAHNWLMDVVTLRLPGWPKCRSAW